MGRFFRRRTTIVAAALGVGFVGFAVLLATQGLDGADKWASVLSLFVGLGALLMALRSGRRGLRTSVRAGDVSGSVTGVKGTPSTDLSAEVATGDVKDGGSVTGIDLTADRD